MDILQVKYNIMSVTTSIHCMYMNNVNVPGSERLCSLSTLRVAGSPLQFAMDQYT